MKKRRGLALTTHGLHRLRARLGTGCNPLEIAHRCFRRAEPVPAEWQVPQKGIFKYYKYGDCVFIFGRGRGGDDVLVTVAGPFGNGRHWVSTYDDDI